MDLKYLFVVEYFDGKVFEQPKEDVSTQDPKRSAFFDVDQQQVARFSLVDQESPDIEGHRPYVGVDLEDGHFEVNGKAFFLHDEPFKDFRLIFFRRHRHHFTSSVEENLKEQSHTVTYRIGWQTNDKDGKNHQRVMEVN